MSVAATKTRAKRKKAAAAPVATFFDLPPSVDTGKEPPAKPPPSEPTADQRYPTDANYGGKEPPAAPQATPGDAVPTSAPRGTGSAAASESPAPGSPRPSSSAAAPQDPSALAGAASPAPAAAPTPLPGRPPSVVVVSARSHLALPRSATIKHGGGGGAAPRLSRTDLRGAAGLTHRAAAPAPGGPPRSPAGGAGATGGGGGAASSSGIGGGGSRGSG
eukprot:4659420-Ditylum_brightwellii.AAC.1